MKKEDITKAIKIIILLGIIFCAIAQFLPWRGFSLSSPVGSAGVDFYPWGSHIYTSIENPFTGSSQSYDIWSIFYLINLGLPDTIQGVDTSSMMTGSSYGMIPTTLLILSFVLCIITIVVGLIALNNKKALMSACLTAILSIGFFIGGIEVTFTYDPTGILSSILNYTFGFFIMIVAAIFFIVAILMQFLFVDKAILSMEEQTSPYSEYTPSQSPSDDEFLRWKKPSGKRCPKCDAAITGDPEHCINCGAKLR